MHRALAFFLAALLVTGCLPHSCQREGNESVTAADSLSREIAATTPVDTLRQLWTTTGPPDAPLALPRTVRFLPDGGLAVSDAEQNALYRLDAGGAAAQTIAPEPFDVPYIAGVRGDTVVVFNAGANRLDFVASGRTRRSIAFERPADETLAYALATDTSLYAKVVGEEIDNVLLRLNEQGDVATRTTLEGPYWRHAGFLRAWGDSLVSLSGFRPVVDLLPMSFRPEARPDTLALRGFDSPMLERSYAFLQGDVTKAPLLSVSAAALGRRLFVLNLRPGWLRVDVYSRNGRLQRVLTEAAREGSRDDYPRDIDVRRTARGIQVAIVRSNPEARVELYEWTAPDAVQRPSTARSRLDRARP
jgi:hypothetical protein